MGYEFNKPSRFYVQYADQKVFAALVKEHGHEDHDPALYWRTQDFETERAALLYSGRLPGSSVWDRKHIEEGAPGCWGWEDVAVKS